MSSENYERILSEEQICQINERYSDLKDDEIIERLAYFELINNEKILKVTNSVPSRELLSISNQIGEIRKDFQKIQVMFKLFVSDISEFKSLKTNLEKNKVAIEENIVNRSMLHLLSSGKLFVDFNENQIKNKYSGNSKEFKQIHQFASDQYDTNFSYRFCYYLRNFSQHVGLPITEIHLKEMDVNSDKQTVNLYIDLDYLLNSSFNWKKMRKELEEKRSENSKIDASDLVEKLFHSMIELYGHYNQFFLELNHQKLTILKEKLTNLGLKSAKYYILRISKYDLKCKPGNYTMSPLEAFTEIDEIHMQLSKIGLVNIINKSN